MEWGAVITAIAGLLLYILKQYSAGKPIRDQEARNDEIQQGRADIANGDADAVSARVDRLLSRQPLPAGQSGNPVTAERIGSVLRMADSGRSHGEDTGTSGSMPKGE